MRLLLDTHIWIWSLVDPARLTPRVRGALQDAKTEVWLSPISVWEAILLAERGRLALEPDPASWVREQLATGLFREAALTWDVAVESRRLALEHDDPADRFIAATARVHDLTLVTSDTRLLRGSGFAVLANV